MTATKLSAATRTERGHQLNTKRKEGYIPAVLYGRAITPATFWVKYLEFDKLYKTAGESTIIDFSVDGKKDVNVLIHDVARDPLSSRFIHVDFYQVRMDEEIEADVPLEFVGESPAVKEHVGILVRSLEEISIKCLPKHLPRSLTVDLSILKTFDDQIKVKDIVLPEGVALDEDGDTIVTIVDRPRTEAEMASLNEKVDMDVTKVEGVVKETPAVEGEAAPEKTDKKEEK